MNELLEIHGLADAELQGEEKARAEAALQSSLEHQREYQSIIDLKQVVATKIEPVSCEETWCKCRRRLEEVDKTKRIEGFVGRYAWGLSGVFLAVIIGAGLLTRSGDGRAVELSDVPRIANLGYSWSDPDSVISRAAAPGLSMHSSDIKVTQAGEGYYQGHHVIRLALDWREKPLELLAIQGGYFAGAEEIKSRQGFSSWQTLGKNHVAWRVGEYGLVLTGDASVTELCQVADSISRR